jgi:hypothetical protein
MSPRFDLSLRMSPQRWTRYWPGTDFEAPELRLQAPTAVADGILFVDDGRLSALEYWWTTDEMPDAFPSSHRIGAPEPRS